MRLRVLTTLRQRVTLLLVSVLVPAVGLVLMTVLSTRSRDRANVQREAYRLAGLASATHARLAETTEQLFASLGQIPFVAAPEAEPCRQALGRIMAAARPFQNLGVVARDGSVLCSATEVAGPVSAGRAWLREALARDVLVAGTYEENPLSRAPTVVLARRVSAAGADRVLFAALDLQWLSELAQTVNLPAQSSLHIVDDEGTVLARYPEHAAWAGRNVRDVPVIAEALQRRDGIVEARGLDGVERLYGFHRVAMPAGTGFTITVGIPVDAAYAPVNARLWASLGLLAVLAVATLIAARHVSERFFTRKIESLLRAARRLSAGDLSARTDQRWSGDELGELARTFDSMAWAVEQRTRDLRQMMESLRALAARLESVREEERTRISREVHDELGQTLTGVRMDLDRLEERVAAISGLTAAERAAIEAKIASVRRLAAAGLDTARRISRQLRPSVLDVLGLKAGVEWQLDEFHARTNVRTELLAPDSLGEIGEDVSIALFRILQESLTNVMRHAAATMVTVRIEREGHAVVMEVMDNGQGFEQSDRGYPASLGLLGMRERAAALGGLTTVTSAPGRGTTVHVTLPLSRPPRDGGPS